MANRLKPSHLSLPQLTPPPQRKLLKRQAKSETVVTLSKPPSYPDKSKGVYPPLICTSGSSSQRKVEREERRPSHFSVEKASKGDIKLPTIESPFKIVKLPSPNGFPVVDSKSIVQSTEIKGPQFSPKSCLTTTNKPRLRRAISATLSPDGLNSENYPFIFLSPPNDSSPYPTIRKRESLPHIIKPFRNHMEH